jgi:hypothetical protein
VSFVAISASMRAIISDSVGLANDIIEPPCEMLIFNQNSKNLDLLPVYLTKNQLISV